MCLRAIIIVLTLFHICTHYLVNSNNHCNIPIYNTLHPEFESLFQTHSNITLPNIPYIIKRNGVSSVFSQLTEREAFINQYGDFEVELSSSNTYSHGKFKMTLRQFIVEHVDDTSFDKHRLSNESYYLFGHNYELFKNLSAMYEIPRCTFCEYAGVKSIGLGGRDSGVQFHMHGPGFSEVIHGEKQWFLFPPTEEIPGLDVNMSVAMWKDLHFDGLLQSKTQLTAGGNHIESSLEDCHTSSDPISSSSSNACSSSMIHGVPGVLTIKKFYHCIIEAGDILYFPDRWMHATLNNDKYNFFVSLFIDKQLLRGALGSTTTPTST